MPRWLASGASTTVDHQSNTQQAPWLQRTGNDDNVVNGQPGGGQPSWSLGPSSLHQCHFCPYIASDRTSLIRHERCHTGERPFRCNVCSCTFARQEYMKVHMRIHTGEKMFACNLCPNAFVWKTQLRRHVNKEHRVTM